MLYILERGASIRRKDYVKIERLTSRRFIKEARLRGSGSVMAAKTDCRAEEGETETVPINAATLGVVSNNALPNEYIHICNQNEINFYRVHCAH